MSAYWIGRAQVRDFEAIKRYGELVARASGIYPQEAVVRNGDYTVLEGEGGFNRHVVIRFPSREAAIAYYHSPEYQEAAAVRQAACDRCELVIVDGLG